MQILIIDKGSIDLALKVQTLLTSFGRGMKVYTAVIDDISNEYVNQSWDYIICICELADQIRKQFRGEVGQWRDFALESATLSDKETEEFHRKIYELYRDELKERLLPRCTCGANDFCRCE